MLVRATRTGYYGDRIRKPGMSFNYKPDNKKKFDKGEEKLPSWMEVVEVGESANSNETKSKKLDDLTAEVDAAKVELSKAEAASKVADENLEKAAANKKEQFQAKAEAANEDLDNATAKLSDAEDALAKAESE